MPKFYMTFARKILFPDFFFGGEGGKCPCLSPDSYAYGVTLNLSAFSALEVL